MNLTDRYIIRPGDTVRLSAVPKSSKHGLSISPETAEHLVGKRFTVDGVYHRCYRYVSPTLSIDKSSSEIPTFFWPVWLFVRARKEV